VRVISTVVGNVAEWLDRRFRWYRLPRPIALFTLIGLRDRLRQRNLFDTGLPDVPAGRTWDKRFLAARTVDGTYNDLAQPMMGSVGSRFGRNIPPSAGEPETPSQILEPNPRTISRELLTRERFLPAATRQRSSARSCPRREFERYKDASHCALRRLYKQLQHRLAKLQLT